MTSTAIDTLPKYFPASHKSCKAVSELFFDCFTKNSVKTSANDTEAGNKALQLCLKEKVNYEKCMERYFTDKKQEKFRVSQYLLF